MIAKQRRKPYLPDSDNGKKTWMERFIAQIETDPHRYGFDDARMFEYVQRTIRTYIKAVAAVSNPALRSPQATLVKNQARTKAVELCREIAMRLKWDPTLSDEEKRSLGIRTEEASPAVEAALPDGRLTGTKAMPELSVVNSPDGGHLIRYRGFTEGKKAKPRGVSHLLLFAAIGDSKRRVGNGLDVDGAGARGDRRLDCGHIIRRCKGRRDAGLEREVLVEQREGAAVDCVA